jgi:hypothetical protein
MLQEGDKDVIVPEQQPDEVMGEDCEDQQDEAEERQRAQIAQKNDMKPSDQ